LIRASVRGTCLIDIGTEGHGETAAFLHDLISCLPTTLCSYRQDSTAKRSKRAWLGAACAAELLHKCYWIVGPPKVGFAKPEQVASGFQSGEVGPQPQDDIVIFEGC